MTEDIQLIVDACLVDAEPGTPEFSARQRAFEAFRAQVTPLVVRALLTAYGKEREAKVEAIRLMSKYASALGEMEGKYKAAHWPGIVDDWRERARLAEDEAAYWKADSADQFKKRQAVEGELARRRIDHEGE